MLTKLRLTNFKAWEDTGDILLRPVTMLLGTNSSGKSTLIQSLLLLKQTVQSPDRSIHLNLGGDEINDLFNFGGFDNLLRQDSSAPRQFSLKFSFKAGAAARVSEGAPRDDKLLTADEIAALLADEGVVVRRESSDWCEARAKLVRSDFTQAIETHWRKRAIEWNRVDYSVGTPE